MSSAALSCLCGGAVGVTPGKVTLVATASKKPLSRSHRLKALSRAAEDRAPGPREDSGRGFFVVSIAWCVPA